MAYILEIQRSQLIKPLNLTLSCTNPMTPPVSSWFSMFYWTTTVTSFKFTLLVLFPMDFLKLLPCDHEVHLLLACWILLSSSLLKVSWSLGTTGLEGLTLQGSLDFTALTYFTDKDLLWGGTVRLWLMTPLLPSYSAVLISHSILFWSSEGTTILRR